MAAGIDAAGDRASLADDSDPLEESDTSGGTSMKKLAVTENITRRGVIDASEGWLGSLTTPGTTEASQP
jgi:hypothetical protein